MTSFAELKKNSQNSLAKLADDLNKVTKAKSFGPDERFWKPTLDKAGNGQATIRFLPASEGENETFVRTFSHGFKGPTGMWYIEESLTTLEQPDPVSEYNSKLWASGIEANRKRVQGNGKDEPGTKRKLTFISNILVVSDPANPENEGKVFLFRYGMKIFTKLNDAAFPKFDEAPFDPFNFWNGANLKLRISKVSGYPNYDASVFEPCGPIAKDEKKIQKIWESQHSLNEFVDPKNFKTYQQLEARLHLVLGLTKKPSVGSFVDDDEDQIDSPTTMKTRPATKIAEKSNEVESEQEDDEFQALFDLANGNNSDDDETPF